jgi:hypothetical protein
MWRIPEALPAKRLGPAPATTGNEALVERALAGGVDVLARLMKPLLPSLISDEEASSPATAVAET